MPYTAVDPRIHTCNFLVGALLCPCYVTSSPFGGGGERWGSPTRKIKMTPLEHHLGWGGGWTSGGGRGIADTARGKSDARFRKATEALYC